METTAKSDLSPRLRGEKGSCVHSSPDWRYEVRRAYLASFPAAALVHVRNGHFSKALIPFLHNEESGPASYLTHDVPTSLSVGDAVLVPATGAPGNCSYIIHTEVPCYYDRLQDKLPLWRTQLANCYRRCLEEAEKAGAESIAFECLGTGRVLGWPCEEASRIGVDTVRRWFKHPIRGAARREKIPGPISFLCEPGDVYQERAWIHAFEELPDTSVPKRLCWVQPRRRGKTDKAVATPKSRPHQNSKYGRHATAAEALAAKREQRRDEKKVWLERGGSVEQDVRSARRGSILAYEVAVADLLDAEDGGAESSAQRDEPSTSGFNSESGLLNKSGEEIIEALNLNTKQKVRKRRKGISQRELMNLTSWQSAEPETLQGPRLRKAPDRYGKP